MSHQSRLQPAVNKGTGRLLFGCLSFNAHTVAHSPFYHTNTPTQKGRRRYRPMIDLENDAKHLCSFPQVWTWGALWFAGRKIMKKVVMLKSSGEMRGRRKNKTHSKMRLEKEIGGGKELDCTIIFTDFTSWAVINTPPCKDLILRQRALTIRGNGEVKGNEEISEGHN